MNFSLSRVTGFPAQRHCRFGRGPTRYRDPCLYSNRGLFGVFFFFFRRIFLLLSSSLLFVVITRLVFLPPPNPASHSHAGIYAAFVLFVYLFCGWVFRILCAQLERRQYTQSRTCTARERNKLVIIMCQ